MTAPATRPFDPERPYLLAFDKHSERFLYDRGIIHHLSVMQYRAYVAAGVPELSSLDEAGFLRVHHTARTTRGIVRPGNIVGDGAP